MINIAYFIDSIETDAAGTEKQLLILLDKLNRDKFRPYLFCLRESEWMKNNKIPCETIVLDLPKLLSFNFIQAVNQFITYHEKYNFDIVQTYFVDANIFGVYAGYKAGVKNIISSRRNIGYWHTTVHKFLLKRLSGFVTKILSNSKVAGDLAVKIENISPDKVEVIYNALDLERFKENSSGQNRKKSEWGFDLSHTVIGYVANLREVKNIPLFIDVASDLSKSYSNLRFVVVGDGPDKEMLQSKINNLNLQEKFVLAGRDMDIPDCLEAFDIGVMCSSSESFSNSLIESMAAGLPLVVSDVGGNVEAIDHEINGLIFHYDDPKGFRGNIKLFLDNRELAAQYGKAAKEKAFANYQMDKILMQYEKFYQSLIK